MLGISLGEAFEEQDGLRELVLATGGRLEGGLFGRFVEAERGEVGEPRFALELFGERLETLLGFGMTPDGGQMTSFDEVGGRGGGNFAELPAERDEFVETLGRAGVERGAGLQERGVTAEFRDGLGQFIRRVARGDAGKFTVDRVGQPAGFGRIVVGDGQERPLPGEAQIEVDAGSLGEGSQPGEQAFGVGRAMGHAHVLDEAPDRRPDGFLRPRAVGPRGFFDHFGRTVPGADLIARLQQAKDALVEGVFRDLRVGRVLLQGGVGFFGEDEVLGEEEAIGGGDAKLGAFGLDAAFGERREMRRGETIGAVAPGGDGERAGGFPDQRARGDVLQQVFGGLSGLFAAAGEEHQLGAGEVDGIQDLELAGAVVGELAGITSQQEVVHFVGDGLRVDRLGGVLLGARISGGHQRAQGRESDRNVGGIPRGFLQAIASFGGVGAEDEAGEEVGFGLAGGGQGAGGGEGLRGAFHVLDVGERQREVAGVVEGERRALRVGGEVAQRRDRALLHLAGDDHRAVAEDFDALTLFFGDGGACDGFLREVDGEVIALRAGDHPA